MEEIHEVTGELHEMRLDNGKCVLVRYFHDGTKLSAGEWLLELERLIKKRRAVVTCDEVGGIFKEGMPVPATSKELVLTWPNGEPRAVKVDFEHSKTLVSTEHGLGPLHLVGEVVE